MRPRFEDPALGLLTYDKWSDAFGAMHQATFPVEGSMQGQDLLEAIGGRRSKMRREIEVLVDELYAEGKPAGGRLGLAWLMLTCDPRQPQSFHRVLPQLQQILDTADLHPDDDEFLRRRLRIWWRASEGEWCGRTAPSIFAIAADQTKHEPDPPEPLAFLAGFNLDKLHTRRVEAAMPAHPRPSRPHLVVMPTEGASRLNNNNAPFREILGVPLPLKMVRDVAGIRAQLHREYPHATAAVDMLMRDLRDGQPLRVKPTILVGEPGCGKSRLVERLASLAGDVFVMRYDASGVMDSQFAGTSKAWSNTEASIPARACLYSRSGNPLVQIDEIEKPATSGSNGSLHHAILPFTSPSTASRYRDVSLDSELDLSMVSYIGTANSAAGLSAPLRDRFRIVKVPSPTLQHLPQLVAQVMADLTHEDDMLMHAPPFAADELAQIGRVWADHRFSLRALSRIVQASLEARDECAMRH